MTFATWLTVVTICALGAMSPGPSLALVLKQTLSGGRRHGVVAALFHGLGIGIYAFLSILGLAAIITTSPTAFTALQWGGALYLAWLGFKGLTAKPTANNELPDIPTTRSAARDGFLIAFFNPKVAVFFLALFSQVVGTDTSLLAKFGYAATALVIDTGWYLIVAWLFSNPKWLDVLRQRAVWFERVFGAVLIALAGRLVAGIVNGR
ncbi:LysE family translocator [Marinobacter zhejiangensis]|uniref:Threonine/homoserine/homoserine lactone efflux protein n=1 Tax=Marinobacter zhejiangensis TaxID=488535 RepID=A0A1I4PW54_9GAMM|nr:LysE family translocator [Marinobacter zhejiangensis]SFM32039.1 Threonine/homoserine/homoserine lactone efflux protein [Marinobacter zhejiangensis]